VLLKGSKMDMKVHRNSKTTPRSLGNQGVQSLITPWKIKKNQNDPWTSLMGPEGADGWKKTRIQKISQDCPFKRSNNFAVRWARYKWLIVRNDKLYIMMVVCSPSDILGSKAQCQCLQQTSLGNFRKIRIPLPSKEIIFTLRYGTVPIWVKVRC